MGMSDYLLLGRSGLRVSRLALGGMTFGIPWTGNRGTDKPGWGMDQKTVNEVLAAYVAAGGNFIDTSDHYGRGASEEAIGRYVKDNGLRDRMVIGTKAGFSAEEGNPNAGGSGRKNLMRSLEGSLRRLGTDYVDLFSLHVWDGMTPADEILRTFDDMVRSGKVRHVGLSNVPAYFSARFQTVAELRGLEPACSMQLEYSLAERSIEFELVPLCRESGMGITIYSPLASGFLSGKYARSADAVEGRGRLAEAPGFGRFSERNWQILDVLNAVAGELGHSPAQVALNWAAHRPAITSVIIGVTSIPQLQANLAALDFDIPPEFRKRLDEASAPVLPYPHNFLRRNARIYLGAKVARA
jgi:aryl-alcohol dehydrogenase-like predicted oxidoreductase